MSTTTTNHDLRDALRLTTNLLQRLAGDPSARPRTTALVRKARRNLIARAIASADVDALSAVPSSEAEAIRAAMGPPTVGMAKAIGQEARRTADPAARERLGLAAASALISARRGRTR